MSILFDKPVIRTGSFKTESQFALEGRPMSCSGSLDQAPDQPSNQPATVALQDMIRNC